MTNISKTEISQVSQQSRHMGSSSSNGTPIRTGTTGRMSSNSESECIEVIDSSSSEVPHQ